MRNVILIAAIGAVAAVALQTPVGGGLVHAPRSTPKAPSLDLSAYPADKPSSPRRLLFIHHSCGGQLFASQGPDEGQNCIYKSHPNGGGLRAELERNGYEVHEASYGSEIGDKTDLFDWLPKFSTKMDKVLACSHQDELYGDGRRNDIVLFKSCFPQSEFVADGTPPGNPLGPELSIANAKATMTALLAEFRKHPNVLFVYVTAPPLAPHAKPIRAWKWIARRLLGRTMAKDALVQMSERARSFNDWVVSPSGWLAGYPLTNVVAFDYYDILTGESSNMSAYPTEDGRDSHPSSEGNRHAARALLPLLNRAVVRLERAKASAQ